VTQVELVYVINSLGAGGAERFLYDLVRHLDQDRFRAQVLCLYARGQFAAGVEAAGVPVHVLDVKRQVVPANWLALWRRMGGFEADIVHTHLHEASWYGLPAAYLRRVPVRISHLQGAHWHWPAKQRWVDRAAETFASITLTCSAAVAEFAHVRLRYPAQKLQVVPNGVDIERFRRLPGREQARRELGLPQESPVLICVGSLAEHKGHIYLFEAMRTVLSEFEDARLLVVGHGAEARRAELEDLARGMGVAGSVTFLGARDDVPELMAASDAFVLASLREGFGIVFAEAGAAGLPSVGSAIEGVPEVVEDGVGGILVPPADSPALAAALLQLLRDPERRREMGEAARARVLERFDMAAITRRVQNIYVELLASGNSGGR
jgi:glycosyltransferase involved in cell wall biosynthesis